jgi:hypothetical protein
MATVLSGGAEKLLAGAVDLLIAGQVPEGFLGEVIMQAEFSARTWQSCLWSPAPDVGPRSI